MIDKTILKNIIKRALEEDIGTGDITTLSTVPADRVISGRFIAKEDGIICGVEVIKKVFELTDKSINTEILIDDGSFVKKGDIIAEVSGSARGILTGERVALNFLQRLSGIASKTNEIVKQIEGTNARITDTRKTTPGLRMLEKYAVKTGGGFNHRFNLSDGILIKDNHIKAAGSIIKAVNSAKAASHNAKIEVETENLEQVKEALDAGADIIMLDNMDIDTMKDAIEIINKKALVEASGNMLDKDIKDIAKTGVDLISVGGLTHTVKAMDISLKFYD